MPKAYMMAGGKAPRKAYWRPPDQRRRYLTFLHLLTYSPPKDEEESESSNEESVGENLSESEIMVEPVLPDNNDRSQAPIIDGLVPVPNVAAREVDAEASALIGYSVDLVPRDWPAGWPSPVRILGGPRNGSMIRRWPDVTSDWRGRSYPSVPRLSVTEEMARMLEDERNNVLVTYTLGSFDSHWFQLNRATRAERMNAAFRFLIGNLWMWDRRRGSSMPPP
jgi:hypothetical protein